MMSVTGSCSGQVPFGVSMRRVSSRSTWTGRARSRVACGAMEGGSFSDVAFEVRVTDTWTGEVKVYANPQDNLASVGDVSAF